MQRRYSGKRLGTHGATCATPGIGNEHSRADRRSRLHKHPCLSR
jgi:hypothetical protein